MDRKDAHSQQSSPAPGGLSQQTATGFAWLLAQTVGIKCVTFAGQIVLAWLLLPEDFGLVALAYSVTTFIVILQNSGVLEVLVQREKLFSQNANPAFWLSATMGVLVAGLILAAGPLAAKLYGEPDLVGLLALLAITAFLSSFEAVPIAQIQIRMRFRWLAILGMGQGALGMGLAVIFAFLGFGPYSFILPLPLVMLLKVSLLWRIAGVPVRLNPEVRQWRSLIGATGLLIGSSFFVAVTQQGANLILGLMHGAAVVGIFYFAYHLTIQIQTLLTLNLAQVLLPSLSKLQGEPRRQVRAYLRVSKILMLLGAPACFLLAAIADPLVRSVFAERWIPAIPVLQFLSVGLAFNITGIVTLNLLKAQGRYAFHFWACVARAGLFILLVAAGARMGGAVMVGAAVATYMLLHGPVLMYAAIRGFGFGWREVAEMYAFPVTAAGIAAAGGLLAAAHLPAGSWNDPGRLGVTAAVMGALYLVLVRVGCPGEWRELAERVVAMVPARLGRIASAVLLAPRNGPVRGG